MPQLERIQSRFEVKFVGPETGADAMTLCGYGAYFNNIDSYGDKIAPGAFADSLTKSKSNGQWPAMLQQHGGWGISADDMMPLGVWTNIAEDEKGLIVEGKLADTTRGREAYQLLKMQPRPALNGLSIGYVAKDYSRNDKPATGEARRTLKKIDLYEISLVTFPANDSARISGVKSSELLKNPREFERALRDVMGLSSREAKAFMAGGFKSLSACDGPESASEALTAGARDERHGFTELATAFKRLQAAMQQSA